MPQVTAKARSSKPDKPYEDFPLFPHATKRWAKKIRGKLHYFGPWSDPDAALAKYLDQRDDLHAGRTPRVGKEGLTVRDLVNRFLTSKRHLQVSGELSQRSFQDYFNTCSRITSQFGLTRLVDDLASDDFEKLRAALATGWGPVTLGNEIQRVRVVFKFAYDSGLIERPVRCGPTFKRPNRRVLRKARHDKGPRMFEAKEIKALLKEASDQIAAMILLGINCGFGNNDVAHLPLSALDLKSGWVSFPRPKTGIARRVPLWPETVKALQKAIAKRPEPKDEAHRHLLFVTKYGLTWGKQTSDNPISKEIAKLLKTLKLDRPGLNFYALRHTFETIGGETRDQVAVDAIMGHAREDMASVYRERVSDERLKAVTDFVRQWLFGKAKRKAK